MGELHGSFFLASGNIDNKQFYKFYYELPDGGKKFGKLEAESVTVYRRRQERCLFSKSKQT